jgi:hypothetical protein
MWQIRQASSPISKIIITDISLLIDLIDLSVDQSNPLIEKCNIMKILRANF